MCYCLSIGEITDIVQKLQNPTPAIISQSRRRQKEIFSNPHHVNHLVDFLSDTSLDDISRIYIIDMIDYFVHNYYNALDVDSIMSSLIGLPSDSIQTYGVRNKIGHIIADLVFRKTIITGAFSINLGTNDSPLMFTSYISILSLFKEKISNQSVFSYENYIREFLNTQFYSYFEIGMMYLKNNDNLSIKCITLILEVFINSNYNQTIIDEFKEESIYNNLTQLASADTFYMMGLVLQRVGMSSQDVEHRIHDYFLSIVSSDSMMKQSCLRKSLSYFFCSIKSPTSECINTAEKLLVIVSEQLKASPFMMIEIMESVFAFFCLIFKFSENPSLYSRVMEFVNAFLINHIPYLVKNDECYRDIVKTMILIWHIFDDPMIYINNIYVHIDRIRNSNDFFDIDCLILYSIVFRSISKWGFTIIDQSFVSEMLKLSKEFLTLVDISNSSRFKSKALFEKTEEYIIDFIYSFLKRYCKMSNKIAKLEKLCGDDNVQFFSEMVFSRIITNLCNNICYQKSIKALKMLLDTKTFLEVIEKTGIIEKMLKTYESLPQKNSIYYTLIGLISKKSNFMHEFLQGLIIRYRNPDCDEDTIRLFKILSGVLKGSKTQDSWRGLYVFIHNQFYNIILESSNNQNCLILLKFLKSLSVTIPQSNPFRYYEPYSFLFLRNSLMFLSNIAFTISSSMKPIDFDESVLFNGFSGFTQESDVTSDKLSHESDGDDLWLNFCTLIETTNRILKSPIGNFGIIKMYDDNCVSTIFSSIIMCSKSTPVFSFLAFPRLCSCFCEFLIIIATKLPEIIIGNDDYIEILISLCLTMFYTSNPDLINFSLHLLSVSIDNQILSVSQIRRHFVYCLNCAVTGLECECIDGFFLRFFVYDLDFADELMNLIINDIEYEDTKSVFSELYKQLLTGEDAIDCRIVSFRKDIRSLPLYLDCFPSLSEYFQIK